MLSISPNITTVVGAEISKIMGFNLTQNINSNFIEMFYKFKQSNPKLIHVNIQSKTMKSCLERREDK